MNARLFGFVVLCAVTVLPGCGHVISKTIRNQADTTLTFAQVLKDPNAFRGKTVIWGGEIIQVTNQKDGGTLIEVFQRRLGAGGEPDESSRSEGRFLVLADEYLDPYIYTRSREITVAGEILEASTRPLGEMDYRYPVIRSKQLYLWPIRAGLPYPPIYYDPWRYPWSPWGYPFGWGWGFGLRYHHHR